MVELHERYYHRTPGTAIERLFGWEVLTLISTTTSGRDIELKPVHTPRHARPGADAVWLHRGAVRAPYRVDYGLFHVGRPHFERVEQSTSRDGAVKRRTTHALILCGLGCA
jgi:hypothetical protein